MLNKKSIQTPVRQVIIFLILIFALSFSSALSISQWDYIPSSGTSSNQTVNLSDYVPYVGAIHDVSLGTHGLTAKDIYSPNYYLYGDVGPTFFNSYRISRIELSCINCLVASICSIYIKCSKVIRC